MSETQPVTAKIRRTCIRSRVCLMLGALLWPATALVWLLHAGGALPSETASTLAYCWLLAAGCYGVPAAGLRVLGPHLTARGCRNLALICLGASIILSVEYATDLVHPSDGSLYASLLLPLAMAVRAHTAARLPARRDQAFRDGVRQGRALESVESDRRDAEEFHAMSNDELRALVRNMRRAIPVIEAIVAGRPDDPAPGQLHIVRDDERRSG